MNRGNLYSELESAVSAVHARDHHPVLAAAGLPQSVIFDAPLGVARIQPEGDYYQPCPSGPGAVVQPLFDYETLPANLDEKGHLLLEPWPEPRAFVVDLIAWLPAQPGRWFFRRKEPALILGRETLEHAALAREDITLNQTPLSWLRDDLAGRPCTGVCVVNPDGARADFIGLRNVDCESEGLGRWFDGWLDETDRPPARPNVRVPERVAA